ncbi:metallophosphoesterase [Streptomyces phage MindFlayer]|nr:phosphoesterase [Streptomyces phage Birchlyn]QFP97504.1 phosphoesterase [Streptomyces phage IchabodCrane]QPL13824.1 metallophosphoesterase [Streptomyces phage MindFlayer]
MAKVMIAGDWHGDTLHARKTVRRADAMNVRKIMQVGDFGYWEHEADGFNYLDALNEECRKYGIKVYFVAGNHENWDRLDWLEKNNPKTYNGLTIIRSHIRYTGRVNRWRFDDRWFQAVGGAVSIDKNRRKLGKTWWAQEAVPERVVKNLEIHGKQSDILLTHDSPTHAPFGFRLKDDPDSTAHRQLMDRVGRVVRPTLWFHGHYHTWMENYPFAHQLGEAGVYGLEMNGMFYNYCVLDTDTMAVQTATGKVNELPS